MATLSIEMNRSIRYANTYGPDQTDITVTRLNSRERRALRRARDRGELKRDANRYTQPTNARASAPSIKVAPVGPRVSVTPSGDRIRPKYDVPHTRNGVPADRRLNVIMSLENVVWGEGTYYLDDDGEPITESAYEVARSRDAIAPRAIEHAFTI